MDQSTQSLVVIENATPLADSREIARQLGVDHRSFFRLITNYQQEIEEDFGKVRFQIAPSGKTNQPQRYALLTDDQTYAYMSYSQNTPQARHCKRLLVKAFAEARNRLAEIARPSEYPTHANLLMTQRLELFHARTKLRPGYWCIFGEVAAYSYYYPALAENAIPDGSVGKRWMQHIRAHPDQFDLSLIDRYQHWYPDQRRWQWANQYPNPWLGAFRTWFQEVYLPEHYPNYIKTRTFALAQPADVKALPPQNR